MYLDTTFEKVCMTLELTDPWKCIPSHFRYVLHDSVRHVYGCFGCVAADVLIWDCTPKTTSTAFVVAVVVVVVLLVVVVVVGVSDDDSTTCASTSPDAPPVKWYFPVHVVWTCRTDKDSLASDDVAFVPVVEVGMYLDRTSWT
jgi:hypothetical protein